MEGGTKAKERTEGGNGSEGVIIVLNGLQCSRDYKTLITNS